MSKLPLICFRLITYIVFNFIVECNLLAKGQQVKNEPNQNLHQKRVLKRRTTTLYLKRAVQKLEIPERECLCLALTLFNGLAFYFGINEYTKDCM